MHNHPSLRAILPAIVVVCAASMPRAAFADLAVGDPAPDFALKDQDGKEVKLSSYAGKKAVVVAFFPKAFTPGCTREMTCMTRETRKVEDRGAVILGISVDTAARQREFATSLGTQFPLLSDEARAATKAYGALVPSPDGGYASRSTFLVDKAGKIAWMEREFAVPKTLDGTALLAALDKIADPADDPASVLAKLASPEKEARTIAVRYLQSQLREDVQGLQALLHTDYGWRAAEPGASWKVRKEAEVARSRKLFDTVDIRSVEFAAVLDPKGGRVMAKGDVAKSGGSGGLSDAALKAAAALAAGDLLVVIPTKAPKVADPKGVATEVIAKELALVIRKEGDAWKILEVVR